MGHRLWETNLTITCLVTAKQEQFQVDCFNIRVFHGTSHPTSYTPMKCLCYTRTVSLKKCGSGLYSILCFPDLTTLKTPVSLVNENTRTPIQNWFIPPLLHLEIHASTDIISTWTYRQGFTNNLPSEWKEIPWCILMPYCALRAGHTEQFIIRNKFWGYEIELSSYNYFLSTKYSIFIIMQTKI
jgi:hypothetical protein